MTVRKCQRCGASLYADAIDAICPACVMQSALASTVEDIPPAESLVLPREFGPYRLIELIGRGGMGVVYRAEQAGLGRTVAIKLLLAGAFAAETALRRFHTEAAAIAALQHPNIVAVYDYGEVDDQPYYAMELVEGRDLATLCDGRPLVARRAAELMRVLAEAMDHAHQHGIVHRDLKPSNILVDAAGRPRIADFGLAKQLGTADGATVAGQMLGSPSYVSPEQASGRSEESGVAGDVYGLGALFYHVLTGRGPFNAATPAETLRLVLETEPASPRLLNPALPRDLETVCLKCLAKDPAHRYPTAGELAADLERFLTDQPIRARPPSTGYWIRKFARRHRMGLAATAAVLFAMLAGLGFALVGFRRAVVQRRDADVARAEAERLVGWMMRDLKPTLEERGGLPQLVEMTEAAVRYYETLPAALRSTRTDTAHADALSALARLRGLSVNDIPGAEAALSAALALREKVVRENPGDPEAAAAWLRDEWERPHILNDVRLYQSADRHAGFYHRWLELMVRFPTSPDVKRAVAEVAALYSEVAAVHGHTDEAMEAATRSRELVDELVAAFPDDPSLEEIVFLSRRSLATAYGSTHQGDKAVATAEETFALAASALQRDPANLTIRRRVAEAARALSYLASRVSTTRSREAELIAREHYLVLLKAKPGDMEVRALYVLAHLMECTYLYATDGHRPSARAAIDRFENLLDTLPERTGDFNHFDQRLTISVMRADLAARAGDRDGVRMQAEAVRNHLAGRLAEPPANPIEPMLIKARVLQSLIWAPIQLGDWLEVAQLVEEEQFVLDDGLRMQPGNLELQQRHLQVALLRGMALHGVGQSVEGLKILEETLPRIRAMVPVGQVYDLSPVRFEARVAMSEAYALCGRRAEGLKMAEWLRGLFLPASPRSWFANENYARMCVLVADQLPQDEVDRRTALLDEAEAILTSPEADERIAPWGRAALERIAVLRNVTP